MIAKDCVNYEEVESNKGYLCYQWCSAYRHVITNCGDDCPKYECVNAKENIAKFFKERNK